MTNTEPIKPLNFFQKLIGPPFIAFVSIICALIFGKLNSTFGFLVMISINFYSVYAFHYHYKQRLISLLWAINYYGYFLFSIALFIQLYSNS